MKDQKQSPYESQQIKASLNLVNSTNAIRKIVQQTVGPLLGKVEEHVAIVIKQAELARLQEIKMQAIVSSQDEIRRRVIDQAMEIQRMKSELSIIELINDCGYISREEQKQQTVGNADKAKIQLENRRLESVQIRQEATRAKEELEKMMAGAALIKQDLHDFKSSLREQLEGLQQKYTGMQTDNLSMGAALQTKLQQISIDVDQTKKLLRYELTKSLENDNKLELYLNERDQIKRKLNILFKHIPKHVSQEEFDKHKRACQVDIEHHLKNVQKVVDSALSPEVRKFLPTIIEKASELSKIENIEKRLKATEEKTVKSQEMLIRKLQENRNESLSRLSEHRSMADDRHHQINIKLQAEAEALIRKLEQKMDKYERTQILQEVTNVKTHIEHRIDTESRENAKRLQSVIQDKKDQIYETVRKLIPNQEVEFFNSLKDIMPIIEKTKVDLLQRCSEIETMALSLQKTLEQFNFRITKIKTDTDLKAENVLSEVRFLQKWRDQTDRRMSFVGKVLALFMENVVMLECLYIDDYKKKKQNRETFPKQVFVSFVEGLIYQLKPEIEEDSGIYYRKRAVEKFDMVKLALTNLLKMVDVIYAEEFLMWKVNKPSDNFRSEQLIDGSSNKTYTQKTIMANTLTPLVEKDEDKSSHHKQSQQPESPLPPAGLFSKTSEIKRGVRNFREPVSTRYDIDSNDHSTGFPSINSSRNKSRSNRVGASSTAASKNTLHMSIGR